MSNIYDPTATKVNGSLMDAWRCGHAFNLTEIPGMTPQGVRALADLDSVEGEVKITNAHQLFGKYLTFTPDLSTVTPKQKSLANVANKKFLKWLKRVVGIKAKRATITAALCEKAGCILPNWYARFDEDSSDDEPGNKEEEEDSVSSGDDDDDDDEEVVEEEQALGESKEEKNSVSNEAEEAFEEEQGKDDVQESAISAVQEDTLAPTDADDDDHDPAPTDFEEEEEAWKLTAGNNDGVQKDDPEETPTVAAADGKQEPSVGGRGLRDVNNKTDTTQEAGLADALEHSPKKPRVGSYCGGSSNEYPSDEEAADKENTGLDDE